MSKVFRLYNTVTKAVEDVRLGGTIVTANQCSELINGSFYICGPTVYSHSHLGHALTYVRADLFRRFVKSIFNIRLATVMNVTDVDDKILAKVDQEIPNAKLTKNPTEHAFNQISEKYYKSFLDDMRYIRVEPPDLIVRVSKQVPLIMKYINRLENKGNAYITPKGDIYFHTPSIRNYVGRERDDDRRTNPDEFKRDPRDFVLWKAAKPGEPVWNYYSDVVNQYLPGRPGWHVQCSAIASAIFGDRLDFHYGGKDLIFPHHYNEEACCCAYHELDTSKSIHVWSRHWLHSGHLVVKDYKMSKSLGNVIAIKNFINDSSINALRLLCISTHYRSNIEFSNVLMDKLRSLDHRLSAFVNYLSDAIARASEVYLDSREDQDDVSTINDFLQKTNDDIIDGTCDDFDLNQGLESLLDLAKLIYNKGSENINPKDLVLSWHLLKDWCQICGLEFGPMKSSHDDNLVQLLRQFRQKVRVSAILGLKQLKNEDGFEGKCDLIKLLDAILNECDNARSKLDGLGFVERDNATKSLPYIKSTET